MITVMRIDEVTWDDTATATLRAAQRAEIAETYGTPDSEPGTPPSAADIAVFVVAYAEDGDPVGCGGLRDLGGGVGEVKRMYVVPSRRGTGVAREVLTALESWARSRGWRALWLETGDRQPAAIRFYRRCGYRPVPAFGAYADEPSSRCFGRHL
ncbi:acetyltransferase (GNAT) family protein [Stackebrandtia albiflava]|uniref:Acetyltransferase (GNAT) family protein n=2 Tax=Stackebrandtia albiflava TaxID=406432 RepID=A0A562V299_9ACTN|nr:acetyltransferase (GNAT) family protein [Stackebrandtia albiflava]